MFGAFSETGRHSDPSANSDDNRLVCTVAPITANVTPENKFTPHFRVRMFHDKGLSVAQPQLHRQIPISDSTAEEHFYESARFLTKHNPKTKIDAQLHGEIVRHHWCEMCRMIPPTNVLLEPTWRGKDTEPVFGARGVEDQIQLHDVRESEIKRALGTGLTVLPDHTYPKRPWGYFGNDYQIQDVL